MNIRLADHGDINALALLNRDVQKLHAEAMPHVFKPPEDVTPFVEDFRQRILADPDDMVFIAEDNHEPMGYVYARIVRRPENAYTYAQNAVYIDQISVRPTCQGQGVGRALIEAVFDRAREAGAVRVMLDTWEFNKNAQAFFAHMGFKVFICRMDAYLANE